MKSLERILLIKPTRNPTSPVLAGAVDLARRFHARLTIADPMPDREEVTTFFQLERLRELAELLPEQEGVEVDHRLLDGDLLARPDELAKHFDLMLLEAGGESGEPLSRSIVRLLRGSSIPIWLDRSAGRPPRRILAAVDVLSADPAARGLVAPVLRHGLDLAERFDAKLDVLTVWSPPGAIVRLGERFGPSSSEMPERHREARRRLEAALESVREGRATDLEPRLLVAGGSPEELISETIRATSIDLVVAGSLGRNGLAGWILGNTVEKLATETRSSILALPPVRGAATDRRAA